MTEPTRILYFAPDASGGGAHVLRDIVSRLDRSDFEPMVVFATGPDDPRAARSKSFFEGHQVPVEFMGQPGTRVYGGGAVMKQKRRDIGKWLRRNLGKRVGNGYDTVRALYRFIRRDWKNARHLGLLLEKHNIGLLHVNGTGGSEAAIVASRLAKVPCVAHVHMFPKVTGFHRYIGRFVSRFLYISNAVRLWCEESGWGQGELLHNGVDTQRFTKTRLGGSRSNGWGCSERDKLVGMLGRIVPWKGQHVFVQAMEIIAKVRPDARAVIVGEVGSGQIDQHYYDQLKTSIDRLDLGSHVSFVKELEDVPALLNDLDVLVHGSVEPEPFGLVIIEGMATATPVVATLGGGVNDIIQPGENGLLVPPNDSKELARSVLRILDDQALAAKLSQKGRQTVVTQFTLEQQVDRVTKVYRHLLSDVVNDSNPTLSVAK
ncbi:MAG: glycosyltransferase family 4 protein [Pseudomonadota bacterium]